MYTKTYSYYVASFTEWLKVIGYSGATVYGMPRTLREFFNWLQDRNITAVEQIRAIHIEAFIHYNKTRANRRREGGISISHINSYIDSINKFSQYLKKSENRELPMRIERLEEEDTKPRILLSPEEIKTLYRVTDESPFGMRDRAMLAIYYGSGLRRKEGIELDLSDILTERKLVFIKKSKNNHQRYVPITATNLKHIEQYIYNARPLLIGEQSKEQALFISERGNRISTERFYQRLQELTQKAGIQKDVGIHTLRHSIATHLLQAGMELENIGLFLGHRCLDSTQLYTQLLNEY